MTTLSHYDLNEETAEGAPDEPGEVFIFDSNKNEGKGTMDAHSIRKYLLNLLAEHPDTKGIRVGWNVSDAMKDN